LKYTSLVLSQVTRHIHTAAVQEGLSKEQREKNNLGSIELGMMFDRIMSMTRGVANWK
jgi:hypothetical protein